MRKKSHASSYDFPSLLLLLRSLLPSHDNFSNDSNYGKWYETTYAIFFLIYGCPMSDTVFKKKLSFKDDDDNGDNDAKVRIAFLVQKSDETKTTTNGRSRAFAVIATIAEPRGHAHGVLSRHWNLLKLCVSWNAGVHGDGGSLAYPASSHGEMRM